MTGVQTCALPIWSLLFGWVALLLCEAIHGTALLALDLGAQPLPEEESEEEVEQHHGELADEQPDDTHKKVQVPDASLVLGERRGLLGFLPL